MHGYALAFCSGTFLCIACADLLPELQFHAHDRFKLSLALFVGLAVAVAITHFGHAGHEHDLERPQSVINRQFPGFSHPARILAVSLQSGIQLSGQWRTVAGVDVCTKGEVVPPAEYSA